MMGLACPNRKNAWKYNYRSKGENLTKLFDRKLMNCKWSKDYLCGFMSEDGKCDLKNIPLIKSGYPVL